MKSLPQRRVLVCIAAALTAFSLLILGCKSDQSGKNVLEDNAENAESAEDLTSTSDETGRETSSRDSKPVSEVDCSPNSERDTSRLMRVRTTKDGITIGVTESDTLGFVMKDVFSAPGEWTFIDRPSTRRLVFDGADEPIEVDVLMYYCVDGMHEYPDCGKPESIGNPDNYEYRKSIPIYFSYTIDACARLFHVSLYDSTSLNSAYAKEFLTHHGFPVNDTVTVEMREMEF